MKEPNTSQRVLGNVRRTYSRLTKIGFPPHFQIVQFPNIPLATSLIAGEISRFVHGSSHAYLVAISYVAETIWAYEELSSGVNWFRRLLGLTYAIILLMRIARVL